MNDARAHFYVTGIVQGVGYRYFAIRKANAYGITGFAKNLIDGRVEIIAEGDQRLIEQFIKDLRIGPISAHVTDIRIEWDVPTFEFKGFQGL